MRTEVRLGGLRALGARSCVACAGIGPVVSACRRLSLPWFLTEEGGYGLPKELGECHSGVRADLRTALLALSPSASSPSSSSPWGGGGGRLRTLLLHEWHANAMQVSE